MSTKNLARTVLERGRPGFTKFNRRYRHSQTRKKIKQYLKECKKDPEYYLNHKEVDIVRDIWGVELSDNLMPIYRFLDSRVGKSWSETNKLIKERFDTRNLAGYHLVVTHILGEIGGIGMQEYYKIYPSYPNDRVYFSFKYFVMDDILIKIK